VAEIDRTVLVQVVPEVEETADFLSLSADEGKGLVAGVVGWVDLTDPGVDDVLAALRSESSMGPSLERSPGHGEAGRTYLGVVASSFFGISILSPRVWRNHLPREAAGGCTGPDVLLLAPFSGANVTLSEEGIRAILYRGALRVGK
jgi:hypothetical protein